MNTFIFAEPEEKKEIISILNQKGLMGNIYCGNTFEDVKGIIDKAPGENRFIASDRKAKNILGQIGLMKSNLFLWTKGTLVRYGDYKTVKLKQKEAVSVGAWQEAKAWNELEYSMDYLNKNTALNSYPVCLQIETGSFCNARCIMCDHCYRGNRSAKWLDKNLLGRLEPLLPYCKDVVLHGNGEPLLHPYISEILEYYRRYEIRFLINSNFSHLPFYFFENAEKCFDTVNVSCDASERDLYEKIRRGLNFNVFMKNVRRFRKKNPNLHMIMSSVLMRQNIEDSPNQVRFAKQLGFNEIHFGILGTNRILHNEQDELSNYPNITKLYMEEAIDVAEKLGIDIKVPKQYLELSKVSYKEAEREKRRMKQIPFFYAVEYRENTGKDLVSPIPEAMLRSTEPVNKIRCRWPFRNMRIDLNGNIGVCCRTSQYFVGNIRDTDNIMDIWNGKVYRSLRDNFYNNTYPYLCENCSYKNMCGGENDV